MEMPHLSFSMILAIFALGTESCRSRESLFTKSLDLSDQVYGDDLLFQSNAVSAGMCSRKCAASPSCASFTYLGPMPTRGTCRGHATRELTRTTATPSAETVAFLMKELLPSNVAVHKTAKQSSEYGDSGNFRMAVDGRLDTDPYQACTHTQSVPGQRSWWQVDLGECFYIYSIRITNRNTLGQRLRYFDVDAYDKDPEINPEAVFTRCIHYVGAMPNAATEELVCDNPPIGGRVVRVTNTPGEFLTLCEVQVMAVPSKFV